MNAVSPNTLGRALRRFFTDHLPRVRGASSHTIQSYRDAFVLLLRFVAAQRRVPVIELDLSHLGPHVPPANGFDFVHVTPSPSTLPHSTYESLINPPEGNV